MSELKKAVEQEAIKTLWSDGKSVDDYLCKPSDVAIFNLFDDIQCLKEDIEERDAEIARLKASLREAVKCVQNWGNLSSRYYQVKYRLSADIAEFKEASK